MRQRRPRQRQRPAGAARGVPRGGAAASPIPRSAARPALPRRSAPRGAQVRVPTNVVSSICDDRGEEPTYAGVTMSALIEGDFGVGDVISLLWFKRALPKYATHFIEMCVMLCADHGPCVSGAPRPPAARCARAPGATSYSAKRSCSAAVCLRGRHHANSAHACAHATCGRQRAWRPAPARASAEAPRGAGTGAHNTIVTSRAGKDLVSCLVSGLLTIGPRFGGAIDDAARYFQARRGALAGAALGV